MDSRSVISFISRNCVETQLKWKKINILLSGFIDASLEIIYSVIDTVSNEKKSNVNNVVFKVVPKITADLTPSRKINVNLQVFNNIKLVYHKFNILERNDLLVLLKFFMKF